MKVNNIVIDYALKNGVETFKRGAVVYTHLMNLGVLKKSVNGVVVDTIIIDPNMRFEEFAKFLKF